MPPYTQRAATSHVLNALSLEHMIISEETFFLDSQLQGTLQSRIRQMVVRGVLSGRFRPGDKMPSSRNLARHLGLSRLTVTLAYQELIADDYLSAVDRSGYFISENAPEPQEMATSVQASNVNWTKIIGQRFSKFDSIEKPANWENYPYPFLYGQADPTLFDHKNWRVCALQALGKRDFTALVSDYGARDDPKLLEFLIEHTLPRRGILARSDEILITAGAQNGLWLAAQILLNQRHVAVTEDPCYFGLRSILHQVQCIHLPIRADKNGLPIKALPKNTDAVFVTPSHHCPTNATMPINRRKNLLKRANSDNFIIVEDDYEFEMSFLHAPTPALKSLDKNGRVIYLGSFSKSLFPGLRLGYMVAPAPFIEEARALRSTIIRHVPGHIQRTTAYFLAHGHYDTLIRRTRNAFQERREAMEYAIQKTGLKIAGEPTFGGSSLWMEAPKNLDTEKLAHAARKDGILIESGTPFFESGGPKNFYRLAYSSIEVGRICDGITKLASLINANNSLPDCQRQVRKLQNERR